MKVCNGVDRWQNKTYNDITINHIHVQNSNETRKTDTNTEVLLRALAFIDCRYSTPKLDYLALKSQAEQAGGDLRIVYDGQEYWASTVDAVPDDRGITHHYQISMV